MTKIYIYIAGIISILIFVLINYIIKSEKLKSDLLKETQFQEITINTVNALNKKQSLIISKYNEIQAQQEKNNKQFKDKQDKIFIKLEQSKSLYQKQLILNNLFKFDRCINL